jgi:hypothetical protein
VFHVERSSTHALLTTTSVRTSTRTGLPGRSEVTRRTAEEEVFRRDADSTGVDRRCRSNEFGDEEAEVRGERGQSSKAELAKDGITPAIIVTRWFGNHEDAADSEKGSGTFGRHRRCGKPSRDNHVERGPQVRPVRSAFRPLDNHLGSPGPLQRLNPLRQPGHPSCVAIEERPVRARPTFRQDESGYTATGSEIEASQRSCGGVDGSQSERPFHRKTESASVIDVDLQGSGAKKTECPRLREGIRDS